MHMLFRNKNLRTLTFKSLQAFSKMPLNKISNSWLMASRIQLVKDICKEMILFNIMM